MHNLNSSLYMVHSIAILNDRFISFMEFTSSHYSRSYTIIRLYYTENAM